MWVDPAHDPRDTGQTVEGERDTVLDYLRAYRLTLRMKCEDLRPEQLAARSVPRSTLSLLGLVRHMAKVERDWFRRCVAGEDVPRLYWSESDWDEAFSQVVGTQECVDDAFRTWEAEMARADQVIAAEPDLGRTYLHHDRPVALRDILVHMVEEYARHCGHADLLRESVDGRTGQ